MFLFFNTTAFTFTGYDTLPIDSMQCLDINSPMNGAGPSCAPTSPYSMDMDVPEIGGAGELNFDLESMLTPPTDPNNLAAWYDTDC